MRASDRPHASDPPCFTGSTGTRTLTTAAPQPHPVQWVFLGPPGVGKGTYASRIAKALGVPHIAAGDLVRAEIKAGSPMGKQVCVCALGPPFHHGRQLT